MGKFISECLQMNADTELYSFTSFPSQLPNVFVKIAKCICQNCQMSHFQNVCHVCGRHRRLFQARTAVEHPMIVLSVRLQLQDIRFDRLLQLHYMQSNLCSYNVEQSFNVFQFKSLNADCRKIFNLRDNKECVGPPQREPT